MRVLILIGRFDVGGIQRQVTTTALGLAQRGHEVSVLAVYPTGRFAEELRASEAVDVQSLDRRSRRDLRALLAGLLRVRATKPDVIYCYHVLPNLLGLVYREFCRGARLVWGLRATDLQRHGLVKRTQFRVSRLLARRPDAIVANSRAVRDFHVRVGYPPHAITVIPNGIDTDGFAPDPKKRKTTRDELGLDAEFVIGVVAQLREKKGHREFLEAFSTVVATQDDVKALIVGDGSQRSQLQAATRRLGLDGAVRWLGYRSDMPALYNALDLMCLPSTFGEGWPNVVGEALACGVPVVATDVGAAKELVGSHGAVVPAASAADLAEALVWAVREQASGRLEWPLTDAAARIEEEFSTERLVDRTERLLQEVVNDR